MVKTAIAVEEPTVAVEELTVAVEEADIFTSHLMNEEEDLMNEASLDEVSSDDDDEDSRMRTCIPNFELDELVQAFRNVQISDENVPCQVNSDTVGNFEVPRLLSISDIDSSSLDNHSDVEDYF